MAKAMVKCLYCGEKFDRLSEPNVKIGRRYAHKKCYEAQDSEVLKEQRDKHEFFEYIKEIYGSDYNFVSISKQAESYIKQYNFTYSGMLKSLKWFYDVKQHSKESSNGRIGIIPYIYEDAKKYYYNLYLAQQRNKEVEGYTLEVKEIVITSPRMFTAPPKLFDLGGED